MDRAPNNDRLFYLKNLAGEECLCGKEKLKNNSFCYRCYKAMPVNMQRALTGEISAADMNAKIAELYK